MGWCEISDVDCPWIPESGFSYVIDTQPTSYGNAAEIAYKFSNGRSYQTWRDFYMRPWTLISQDINDTIKELGKQEEHQEHIEACMNQYHQLKEDRSCYIKSANNERVYAAALCFRYYYSDIYNDILEIVNSNTIVGVRFNLPDTLAVMRHGLIPGIEQTDRIITAIKVAKQGEAALSRLLMIDSGCDGKVINIKACGQSELFPELIKYQTTKRTQEAQQCAE